MSFAKKLAEVVKAKTDAKAESHLRLSDLLNKIKVKPEIQQERYNICLSCEKLYKPTSSCRLCGCFMQIKTWMPDQRCPVNKWLEAPPAEKTNEREGQ